MAYEPIIFSYNPGGGQSFAPLKVETGANNVGWSYGLNTETIPTYGGQVVQILSAYVEDITIQGDARTYAEMEKIYTWFLRYMRMTTQEGKFNERPIHMAYPARGWNIKIQPKSLPGFRYGTDVVAPTWQIQGQVVENDADMAEYTMNVASEQGWTFDKIHAGIGWQEENPFTDPLAQTKDEKGKKQSKVEVMKDVTKYLTGVAENYNDIVKAFVQGDYSGLKISAYEGASGPVNNERTGDQAPGKKAGSSKNGVGGFHQQEYKRGND